jgi:hypothetical protein
MWVCVLSSDVHPRFEICALTFGYCSEPLPFHLFYNLSVLFFAQHDLHILFLAHNAPSGSPLH